MKARTSFTLRRTESERRQWMVWLNILLACYTLHEHFGFGQERLKRFLTLNGEDAVKLGQMGEGYAKNKTWEDELWAWGESMGLNEAVK